MKKHSQSNNEISYQIVYKKIKNLWMKLNNKNEIVISAPIGTKQKVIDEFVDKHIEKFIKHINEKKNNLSIDLQNNSFYLFGNKIFFRIDETNSTKIILSNGDRINVRKKTIEESIEAYRKKQLKIYLIVRQLELQKQMKIENHLIYVRNKTNAWATNHVLKRKIYYSINLSPFSKEIIDYVIVHELAHNKYSNHSKDFWNLVEKYEPQYKQKKLKLKKYNYS